MASSSTVDVLDEATMTLIADVKHMKEAKTPQQVEHCRPCLVCGPLMNSPMVWVCSFPCNVYHTKRSCGRLKCARHVISVSTKLQALGRHLQLQDFRTWLNHKCHLPINICPNNTNTREYMDQEQIEEWIDQWTKNNAKGKED